MIWQHSKDINAVSMSLYIVAKQRAVRPSMFITEGLEGSSDSDHDQPYEQMVQKLHLALQKNRESSHKLKSLSGSSIQLTDIIAQETYHGRNPCLCDEHK